MPKINDCGQFRECGQKCGEDKKKALRKSHSKALFYGAVDGT